MLKDLTTVTHRMGRVDTATVLRTSLLALAAVGIIATAVELATLRHWTTTTQLIPWIVLGVLAIGVGTLAVCRSRRMIQFVRLIACIAAVGGLYGLYIHVQSNYDAAILDYHYTDRWPTMSLASKVWAAGTGQVGPSPVMAPAVLSQVGICLALATFRHPLLAPTRGSKSVAETAVRMGS